MSGAVRGPATAKSSTRRWSSRSRQHRRSGGARRDRSEPARRCCGDSCASGARPTSCSARRRRASCGYASRRRGLAPALRAPRLRDRGAPVGSRWSGGTQWSAAGPTVPRHVLGHVEVRWSHGLFCGPPEAKVYLDTPHTEVPGYFRLDLTTIAGLRARPRRDERGQRRVDSRGSRRRAAGSPSSSQCSNASNTNDTSVSAAHAAAHLGRRVRLLHELSAYAITCSRNASAYARTAARAPRAATAT